MKKIRLIPLILLILVTLACGVQASPIQVAQERATRAAATDSPPATREVMRTARPDPTQTALPSPSPAAEPSLWIDPSVPEGLRQSLQLRASPQMVASAEQANLHLGIAYGGSQVATWVYALVAPFPTVTDGVTLADLRSIWRGQSPDVMAGAPLMMAESTLRAFEGLWGKAQGDLIQVVPEADLLDTAWQERPAWALTPFERLDPRWKVLQVDGDSPIEKTFNLERYPLVIKFGLEETTSQDAVILPATNRDPTRLTTVAMTGVSALVRSIAAKMEANGMTYPGQDIVDWLRGADITHISNEVSFEPRCPDPKPANTSLMFCSKPEYLELYEYSGADVIELSGNHLVDWRVDSLSYTLNLLKEHGLKYYASGNTLEEARQPLLLENNGNKIAFIGCNPAGPETVWATSTRVGAASCDYDWMKTEIAKLRQEGYVVIATLQYFENYSLTPSVFEVRDFTPLAEAGADIVSGSQAHYPKGMAFVNDRLVHFGLGNLYFDQMRVPDGFQPQVFDPKELPIAGTRLEFIDRHVIYDGKYISTELLTAVLEDYAQPRPMTPDERAVFLREAFKASGW